MAAPSGVKYATIREQFAPWSPPTTATQYQVRNSPNHIRHLWTGAVKRIGMLSRGVELRADSQ